MRRTYAHNMIIIGVLSGACVGMKAGTVPGIIVAIVVSIVGYVVVKKLENAAYDKVDEIENRVAQKRYDKKKEQDGKSDGESLADRYK